MVYYGVMSKGCHRCRQRKVKACSIPCLICPGCLRCEKAKTKCPGFRNLTDVMFRDESERIIRKARKLEGDNQIEQPRPPIMQESLLEFAASLVSACAYRVLSQPVNEIGVQFFFSNYSCYEPPLSEAYHVWLTNAYREAPANHALRAAIEAAGMAGISNTFYAPEVASRSKEKYGQALAATKQALCDPAEAVADTTLITVILLGLFEFITLENWDHYDSWAAHMEGAITLLQLRGQGQFNYERGGQLFMQIRSQILYACMQRDTAAPQAFHQICYDFKTSAMGERRKTIAPVPLGDTCFRLLELRGAIKRGDITDPETIRDAAIAINRDLETWRATVPSSWRYTVIDVGDAPTCTYFEGKSHVYSNPWTAQVWNNWRTLRILVNQIILENCNVLDSADGSSALSLIRRLSTEICISAPNFMEAPRKNVVPIDVNPSLISFRRFLWTHVAAICRGTGAIKPLQ
ncbi:hypothetical protein NA57DRAFT_44915 [Rhizodiscina lignyota]|uniref:Zn(2)-C6 fungal-type domain-containing protein n=1 Tax=Rhizodiscina lignyota TaxID=1504668 RepID=A0A9P4M1W7_9PEZI|nr:hypothetical protein NA57DRAFT_44915 [Rhizodiscina lignyota]